MAMQTVGPVVPLAHNVPGIMNVSNFLNSLLIDAAGEKVSVVFRVPQTGSLRTIRFRLGTVTTGQTLRGGIYTVDASGLPTTTAYGGMAVGTVTVADTDDNVEKVITLVTDASATEGDVVALTIEFDATVGSLNINVGGGAGLDDTYAVHLGAKNANIPLAAIGYSDGTYPYIPGLNTFTGGVVGPSVNVNTAVADEYALLWSVPYKVRLRGMLVGMAVAAGADFEYINYNGTTAVTGMTGTRDGDALSATNHRLMALLWGTTEVLAPNTTRRLAIRPTTVNGLVLPRGTVGTLNAIVQACGYSGWQTSRRLDQGAWDDTLTTELPWILPIYDQLSDDVGGGGGLLTHPGMSGGMRG